MQAPLDDQMQGTPFDQLGELDSRICYDSFGRNEDGTRKGRPSDVLHEHILQVDNTSVHEHQNFTLKFPSTYDTYPYIMSLMNRKGIFVEYLDHRIEVTTNLRAILKWDRCTTTPNLAFPDVNDRIRDTLQYHASILAPKIVKLKPGLLLDGTIFGAEVKTKNLTENQAWISLWLYGSRGFTHEQVRHRFAISQRSTRYVDESSSPWIEHPLITKFFADKGEGNGDGVGEEVDLYNLRQQINKTIHHSQTTYDHLVEQLTKYCRTVIGLDKVSARKQARGAARGYLGNALASEMIFSASIANWKWILSQRKNKAADAEIREVYTPGLAALKSSQYGYFFDAFETIPSPDGIGTVLA